MSLPIPENFGVYLVSFPFTGKNVPANYPEGYKYWCYFDDAGIEDGAWHFEGQDEQDIDPAAIYEDEYPYPSDHTQAYAPSVAGAASGPLLAYPLPPGITLPPAPRPRPPT